MLYTLGFDGSSEFKRITFNLPKVLNQKKQQVSLVADNSVTTNKLQSSV